MIVPLSYYLWQWKEISNSQTHMDMGSWVKDQWEFTQHFLLSSSLEPCRVICFFPLLFITPSSKMGRIFLFLTCLFLSPFECWFLPLDPLIWTGLKLTHQHFFFLEQALFSLSARAGEQEVPESQVTECLVTVKNTTADSVCAEVVSEMQGIGNMPFLIVFLQLRTASAEIKGIIQGTAQK